MYGGMACRDRGMAYPTNPSDCISRSAALSSGPLDRICEMTAYELMRRLRADEIDYREFVKESEELSLEELQALTPLLIEWAKEPRQD
jgi:hypothetical protein